MDRTKDLETFCKANNRQDLLDEWDYDRNKKEISRYKYNSPSQVYWKCEYGHSYSRSIAARTIFKIGCYHCNSENISLPIGTKYGCLTIIDDFSAYEKEIVQKRITDLEKRKQDFLNGKRSDTCNIDSADYFDKWIQDYKSDNRYKCQCKCGKIHFLNEYDFLIKKHRYCNRYRNDYEQCGLREKHQKELLATYKRIKDESYDIDFCNTIHESLEILNCVDDNYEQLYYYTDRRKYGGGTFKVYKKYKCYCYLCGKKYEFKSSDFEIKLHTYRGYDSYAHCDCHTISSFQWRTIDILKKNNINYKVEVSFEDLYGVGNTNLLRYDFAIYDDKNNIKCLIECQGEQHYKPIKDFGGNFQYNIQKQNDQLKRDYAKQHDISMIEIPYTCDTYEKEEEFLKSKGLI